MQLKPIVVAYLVLCGLLLCSCSLFYAGIPPMEFRVERDHRGLELHVLSMSRGSHRRREDGAIITQIPSADSDITFMVESGNQKSQFAARVHGHTGLKGSNRGVRTTYGFGGGMWLATEDGDPFGRETLLYEMRGVAASKASFVVGRFVFDGDEAVPLIDKVAPHSRVQLDPRSPGVLLTGHGGTSVLADVHPNPGKELDIYAPAGSFILIEQGDGTQELKVGSSLPLHVVMRPGRAKIRWLPAGSNESHVEITIDAVSDENWYGDSLSFSSMLDA